MSVKLIESVLCQTNPLSTLHNALDVTGEDYNSTTAHVLISVLYSLNYKQSLSCFYITLANDRLFAERRYLNKIS